LVIYGITVPLCYNRSMRCSYCGEETGTKEYKCKKCARVKSREAYRSNPEKFRERKREFKKNNPEKQREYDTRARRKLKSDVIGAYGGVCTCCGEKEMDFLCIDHVDNNGSQHRKLLGTGNTFYFRLRKDGYPNTNEFRLQVLCYNCNNSKKIRGVCIHNN